MILPPEMKSGRQLVAVNEERTVGLYGSLDDGYRILLADRTITRGEYGTRPYPRCPDGKWFWKKGRRPAIDIISTRKSAKRLRREEADRQLAERTNIKATGRTMEGERPDFNLCVDCRANVKERGDSHWHESHPAYTPVGLKPGTVCCPCAGARGYLCPEARQRGLGGAEGPSGPTASRRGRAGRKRPRRAF